MYCCIVLGYSNRCQNPRFQSIAQNLLLWELIMFSLLDVLGNKEISWIIWPGLAQVKFVFTLGFGLSSSFPYCFSSFSLSYQYSSLCTQLLRELQQKEISQNKKLNNFLKSKRINYIIISYDPHFILSVFSLFLLY